jgi:hypothetical protein
MAYRQIRVNKTADLDKVLTYLKQYYPLLSEVEIVKVLLSRDFAEKRLEERMMLQNSEDIMAKPIESKEEEVVVETNTPWETV